MDHETAVSTHAAERYTLREMNEGELSAFEEHFFSCELCAEDVRNLAIFVENAKAVFRESPEAIPLRTVPAPGPKTVANRMPWFRLPVAVAAGLAAVFGVLYTTEASKAHRLSVPQLGPAAVLHGQTRGGAPRFEAGKPINLYIALEQAVRSPNVSAEVRRGDGSIVNQITATVPPGANGITLYLPDPQLQPGPYSIVVEGTKYPFEIY